MPSLLPKLLHTNSRQPSGCTSSSCSCSAAADPLHGCSGLPPAVGLLLKPSPLLPLLLMLLVVAQRQLCLRGAELPPVTSGFSQACRKQKHKTP
jgi:hypothetical protein